MLDDDDLDLWPDRLAVLYAEHPGAAAMAAIRDERRARRDAGTAGCPVPVRMSGDRQVMMAASRALAITWRDWFARR